VFESGITHFFLMDLRRSFNDKVTVRGGADDTTVEPSIT
jgi:hypothetical protein